MPNLRPTLGDIAAALNAAAIPYAVIGGVAAAGWGVPRTTTDIDITIGSTAAAAQQVIAVLGDRIVSLPEDPTSFAADTGVLPFLHRSGVRVELMLSTNPFALDAIARSIAIDVEGVPVRFCSPEDLVLHKIISERERDRADVAALIELRRDTLDRAYLDPRVHELAEVLAEPQIEARYRALMG